MSPGAANPVEYASAFLEVGKPFHPLSLAHIEEPSNTISRGNYTNSTTFFLPLRVSELQNPPPRIGNPRSVSPIKEETAHGHYHYIPDTVQLSSQRFDDTAPSLESGLALMQ
ncbi:hypothetical protein H9L39_11698 [Fusarium oxysporum f. sp. albedinis]|nr:hypothetical protein H9L39_11698 [Fusarium oxysporum f. sp. albedinis]